jgi:hypothetical protein
VPAEDFQSRIETTLQRVPAVVAAPLSASASLDMVDAKGNGDTAIHLEQDILDLSSFDDAIDSILTDRDKDDDTWEQDVSAVQSVVSSLPRAAAVIAVEDAVMARPVLQFEETLAAPSAAPVAPREATGAQMSPALRALIKLEEVELEEVESRSLIDGRMIALMVAMFFCGVGIVLALSL